MKKKLFSALLAAVCLSGIAAAPASAAEITTTDATALKAATAPVIDGVYDPAEGWGDPIVTIVNPTAPEYLALCASDHPELLTDTNLIPSEINVYFRWDDTYFYYCGTAVQEQRSNVYGWSESGNIWMGDSIVFNFKSTTENDSYSRAALALSDTDGVIYHEYAAEDGTAGMWSYDDWKVTRDDKTKTTTYEIRFKWDDATPEGTVAVGDIVYFRDLFMPANSTEFQNPVDVNTAGITASGSYNYWKITLAEEGAAAAEAVTETAAPAGESGFVTYTEYPETPGTELLYATGDMDMLTGYDAKGGIGVDLHNLASGGDAYCLKNDTSVWYDFEVSEKTEVTFYIGYIARTGANRGLDYAVDDPNGENRIFMDLAESAEQQWVSGTFTVDAGKHTFYLYAPTGMDDSTLKSCDVYSVELYGTPAAAEETAEPVVEETPVAEEAPAAEAEEETAAEETPVETAEEEPAVEEVVTEAPVVEAEETAPQTFDLGIAAAVSALVSLAGYMVSKKR